MEIIIDKDYNLTINDVKFDELPESEARDRAGVARAKTTINMNGPTKYAFFPLIRNGKLIQVIV